MMQTPTTVAHGDHLMEGAPPGEAWSYRPEFDALRALAIVAVVLYHYSPGVFPGGYLGVTTFFVLSGYLITGLLTAELLERGQVDLGAFLARRALRLYPALVVSVLLTLVAAHVADSYPVPDTNIDIAAVASLLYLNDLLLGIYSGVTGWFDPTWSLGVELQFYLVWPLILLSTLRVVSRSAAARAMLAFAVAAGIVTAITRSTLGEHLTYYTPIGSIMPLVLGCAVALTARTRLPRRTAGIGLGLLALLLLVSPVSKSAGAFHGPEQFASLAAAVVVWCVASAPGPGLLRTGALVWLGRRSYSLYLVHQPIHIVLVLLLPHAPGIAHLAIGFPVTVIVAAASFRVVEQPFLRRKARMSRVRRLDRGAPST